jgi:hypothetical protein
MENLNRKNDKKVKDLQSEKVELEKKNSFNQERID